MQHTKPAAPLEEERKISGATTPAALNLKFHAPRQGLARALACSPNSHQQACSLYQEIIPMSAQLAPNLTAYGKVMGLKKSTLIYCMGSL
ncbi:hypothetical protein PHYPO_G00182550 [Pangasianodon hypophthalmus]|uniref:Uncharacterized protein n=1 Tax=Pangasianodon hypophthalmus TaxID=310915 RepID=A0A5N5PQP1_PANHP|nr:hypothetical protein PHYPO_G00182550 [Pangasianodon hypophthalmus]